MRSIAASATTTCPAINIPASWLLGTTLCVYSSLSVQRRLLAVSTVLDKCAWAVSSFYVDLPTLVNYTSTIRLSFRDFISQADQQLTRFVIFSIFVASVYYLFNFCCLRLLRVVLKLSRSAWDPRLI